MKHMTIMDIENNRGFKVKYMTVLADINTDPDDEELQSPVVKSIQFFETEDTLRKYLSEIEEGFPAFGPVVYELVNCVPVERKYTLTKQVMVTGITLT